MGERGNENSGNQMIIFDSNSQSKWKGKSFTINNGYVVMGKSASAEQGIPLAKGSHSIKIIGKKRTGNGKLDILIVAEDGVRLFKTSVSFTKASWTEFSFSFDSKLNFGRGKLIINRPKRVFGSIEIGRVLITKECSSVKSYENASGNRLQNQKTTRARRLERARLSGKSSGINNIAFEPYRFRKRVAFVIPYSIYGGAEVYLRDIIMRMDPNDYEVTLIYMSNNILGAHLGTHPVNSRVCKNLKQLEGVLVSEQFDSVVYYNRADIYELISELASDRTIISKIIEIYHSDFKWPGSLSNFNIRRNVDTLFRVADSLGGNISGIPEEDKITVPVGINLDKFRTKWSKGVPEEIRQSLNIGDSLIIGTVARLSKEKNLDYNLELAKELPNFQFLIIGDGPERGRLEKRVEDEGINNVNFTGFVKNPELYYGFMDAFILASTMEGTPISILEAMASGKLVFSNMVGAIPSILEDGVTGFKITGDPSVDSKIIKNNISNQQIRDNAVAFVVKNHDIDINSKIFLEKLLGIGEFIVDNKYPDRIILEGEYI